MLTSVIHIRPADEHSATLALQEIAAYVRSRDALVAVNERFRRLATHRVPRNTSGAEVANHCVYCGQEFVPPEDEESSYFYVGSNDGGPCMDRILPEWHERAKTERATKRTGRKPSVRCEVLCSGRIKPRKHKPDQVTKILPRNDKFEANLAKLWKQWKKVEIVNDGLVRNDIEELAALAIREVYTNRECRHETFRLAQMSAAKARHALKDPFAGRAAIRPQDMRIVYESNIAVPTDFILSGNPVRWQPYRHRDEGQTHAKRMGAVIHTYAEALTSGIDASGLAHLTAVKTAPVLCYDGTKFTLTAGQQDRLYPETIAQAWIQVERGSSLKRKPPLHWTFHIVYKKDRDGIDLGDVKRGVAGLDTGWSTRGANPLRVAYVYDDSGKHYSLDMPEQAWERFEYAQSIQANQSREADQIKRQLGLNQKTSISTLVERYPDLTEHLVHLELFHRPMLSRQVARRNDWYREVCDELCRRSHTIRIERINYAALLRKCKSAGEARQLKAPGKFISILRERAKLFGTKIEEVNPAFTSRVCSCGNDMGPSAARVRDCGVCGTHWDRDELGAFNILNGGARRSSGLVSREEPSPLAAE